MTRGFRLHDATLFALALVASLMGLFFIYDAGFARSIQAGRGSVPREFVAQAAYLVAGLVLFAVCARVRGDLWARLSKVAWLLTLCALVAVELPGIGLQMNGAQRWIRIGTVNFQPSEFAKLTLILYLAGALAFRKPWPKKIRRLRGAMWVDNVAIPKLKRLLPALWASVGIGLIALEPDLGTAAVLAFAAYAMFCLGGVTRKSLVVGFLFGAAAIALLVAHQPYRIERILAHSERYSIEHMDDVGYQTVQSEQAMASGGLIGVGPGAGRAKHVLPAATTDFIPSTIAEEFGFLGWLMVVGVLAALVLRLFVLALACGDLFGSLLLAGVGSWIGVQSLTNLLMANGVLPAIGIPLPFVSSGGSSLLALWCAMGICQSALAPKPMRKEAAVAARDHRWGHRRTRLSRA
jgi:cell division protein FtsW